MSLLPLVADANSYLDRPQVQQFIDKMVNTHQFDRQALQHVFQTVKPNPLVLQRIQKPAESLEWHDYQRILLTPMRLQKGLAFWDQHAQSLVNTSQRYHIPIEIIIAILGIET